MPGGVLHIRVDAGVAEMSAPYQGGRRRTSFCNLISFKAGGRAHLHRKPWGGLRRERGLEQSRCQEQLGEESLRSLRNLGSLRSLACLINPGSLGRLSCLRGPKSLRNPGGAYAFLQSRSRPGNNTIRHRNHLLGTRARKYHIKCQVRAKPEPLDASVRLQLEMALAMALSSLSCLKNG